MEVRVIDDKIPTAWLHEGGTVHHDPSRELICEPEMGL